MKRSAEIFEMVVELGVDAREVLLDRECGQDAALRAEVESLLEAHAAAGAFLGEPTHTLDEARTYSGRGDESATADTASAHASRSIGRYKLLERIGEGGFGTVWMAEQHEPVKRRVALKIIKRGMDSRQVIARFEAERQALAMMDHPNIAKVLDGGSTDTGQPYFVMEYIRGVPILQYCDTAKLDTRARLDLFVQTCQAIQHAHQKGIIHRDIKPTNVLITLHDGVPVVKVIDFGVAKATNVELTTRTLFTQHHQMIGTPAYMSPEQAEMSGLDIDTRCDVYSLGVLLYELLTGTTPFTTKELMAHGFAEMMRIIREEEPHKPSTRLSSLGESATQTAQQRHTDVARLGTLLRGDLDWIVMKCLEKDRTRRYETASGLAEDIRRHLTDEPVAAGPPSATYRMSKFLKRHRAGALAATAVATVLILGIAGTTAGMLRAIHQRERAELAEEGMERELNRATEVKGLIGGMLSGVNPQVARGQDKMLLLGILDDAASRLLRGEIEDELIAAEMHHVVGAAYSSIGALDQAARHLPLALEIRERRLGKEDPATLHSMHAQLDLGLGQGSISGWPPGRRAELESMAAEIVELRERALGPEHPDTLTSMEQLGTIVGMFGRLDEAEPIITKCLEARARALGPEHRDTLESMAHMGLLYLHQGRLTEAEPVLEEVLETRARVLGEYVPDTLFSVTNLFELYEMQDRHEESLPLRQRSVLIAERVFGDRHPYMPGLRLGLGSLYFILGRYEDAASTYENDLQRRRIDGKERGSGVPPSADEVLNVYWRVHRGAMATPVNVRRAAARNLATSYDMIGRRGDALALYRGLLEHGPEDPDDDRAGAFALFTVAWALSRDHPEVNDPARALEFARRAVEKAEASGNSRGLHLYLDMLALVLHQNGATVEAIETEQRAIARIPEIRPRPFDARTDDTIRASYQARLRTYEASLAEQAAHPTEDTSP